MVADFDFRGMADILGTHIGFLEMRCEGTIVSDEQVTHKCSFDFGFGAEASHVDEFTVGRVWRYTLSGIKGRGQGERGEDSKKCRG